MTEKHPDADEYGKKQRLITNAAAGGIVLLSGVFLLLAGLGLLGETLTVASAAVWAPLCALGLILLVASLAQRSALAMWTAVLLLLCALVTALNNYGGAAVGYRRLYPVYIAAPGIASLFAMLISRDFAFHIKAALLFVVTAAVFSLESGGVVGLAVVIPCLILLLGAVMVFFAVKDRKKEEDDDA
ncbi:MAG: hypothetical protein LBH24_02455 [Clostridiales bacterium]|jgi:hypothetical protein|nr:hypothetical protein [Clostridiales bacterium]